MRQNVWTRINWLSWYQGTSVLSIFNENLSFKFFVLGILLCQKAKMDVGSWPGNLKKIGLGLVRRESSNTIDIIFPLGSNYWTTSLPGAKLL